MKVLGFALAALLVLIQYPLWLGKGGWLRVWELDRQVSAQLAVNSGLRARNVALQAEVDDLREGRLAIEERARYELGMVKPDEIFVRVMPSPVPASGPASGAAGSSAAASSPRPAAGR